MKKWGFMQPLKKVSMKASLHRLIWAETLCYWSTIRISKGTVQLMIHSVVAEPDSSVVIGLENRRLLVRSPTRPIFLQRINVSHCDRIHSSLSFLSIVSTTVIWESSQWLGKNIVRSTYQKNCRKA